MHTEEFIYEFYLFYELDWQRFVDQEILAFLDSKIKSNEEDPDGRWITTWNHYLSHLKYFFRWLHNV